VECDLVVDDIGHTRPFRDVLVDLVSDLMPVAERLECPAELADLVAIVDEGPSYVRQRRIVEAGGNLVDVVAAVRGELLDSLAADPT
jgi:carboxylate-amine ligase